MIGISKHSVEVGKEIYYYPWYDWETGENDEPIMTKISYGYRNICGQDMCHVEGVSGAVALTHLSFKYKKKTVLTPQKRRSKARYQEYLKVADCYYSFHHFLTGKY